MPEEPAKTRLVIIPETWFKFMYEKMGVSGKFRDKTYEIRVTAKMSLLLIEYISGPYTLGIGFFLFLVQKEYIITEGPHWDHLCAWYFWWYTFTRTQLGNIASYALNSLTRVSLTFVSILYCWSHYIRSYLYQLGRYRRKPGVRASS